MNTKKTVAKLLKKYEDGTVSVIDDFLEGHCHEFALALNKVFEYRLGLIKSRYTDKDGKEKKVLLHAFAIDSKGQAYDVEGKYDVAHSVKGYTIQKNPTTGEVLKNVSYNIYETPKKFKSKLWTIPVDQAFINKAIKKITKDPLTYFRGSNIVKVPPIKFKTLETNERWAMKNDLFYRYRQDNKLEDKLTKDLKKDFGTIDHKWVIKDAHFVWKGLAISIGLGTYDFELVDNKIIEIDNTINDKLTDEESKKSIDTYMKELTDFVTTSPEVKAWFKKTLKIKEGALSMRRDNVIKRALKKLTIGTLEDIKKELLDYIKSEPKEIFNDRDDVKLSGRVWWNKFEEDYELKDMEIVSAKIQGFAHYLLHDLYEGKIPDKEQRIADAELLHKEFVGKTFPFQAYDKDATQQLSGEIKVLETKYDSNKDEVIITKHKLEDIRAE